MAFCCHCGKLAEGGRFCAACGGPIAPDAVEAMTAQLHRHHQQMRLMVVALGLVFLAAGLFVIRVMYVQRAAGRSFFGGETSSPALHPQPPLPAQPAAAQTPPGQAIAPDTFTSPPQQPPQVPVPDEKNPSSRLSPGSTDPQAAQSALTTPVQHGKQRDPSLQQLPAPPVDSSSSDRYPGSQPVEVKDANLPDIGIPVASEVYTTSDSLSTVISYYRQRYPDAEVTELNGQKIIAVSRPGATKVIAIGTTGSETRIAIVQPAN